MCQGSEVPRTSRRLGLEQVEIYPVIIEKAGTITAAVEDATQALVVGAAARMTVLESLAVDSIRTNSRNLETATKSRRRPTTSSCVWPTPESDPDMKDTPDPPDTPTPPDAAVHPPSVTGRENVTAPIQPSDATQPDTLNRTISCPLATNM